MSASVGPSLQNVYQPISVFNALVPKEGPKAVPYNMNFTTGAAFTADLRQTVSQGYISVIQSVWIDNSANSDTLSMTVQGTNFTINAPAYSQGFYPVTVGPQPVFQFSSASTSAAVAVEFLNVPVPASVWTVQVNAVSITGPADSNGNVLTVPGVPGNAWSSYSGATANPAASTQLIPAPVGGKYAAVLIKAPEAADMWVNPLGGTAAVDGLDCFPVRAGQVYESSDVTQCNSEWTYYCTATAANYTALARKV